MSKPLRKLHSLHAALVTAPMPLMLCQVVVGAASRRVVVAERKGVRHAEGELPRHREMASSEPDVFKESFKHYKRRQPPPDLGSVLDFTRAGTQRTQFSVEPVPWPVASSASTAASAALLGLRDPSQWEVYTLPSHPGFLFIVNPFQDGCQHYWVRRCLVDYPLLPNRCNLDAHSQRQGTGQLWPADSVCEVPVEESAVYKLRWVTSGYLYDWDTKRYYHDRQSPFPSDLAALSSFVVRAVGFKRFTPEAAIINYYHMDSTLSGHTDQSELDHTAPLISVSFGQSAIFLLGGKTKAMKPTEMFIRSGDIVVMSGDSRLAYHAIPRILRIPGEDPLAALSPEMLRAAIGSHGGEQEGCKLWVHHDQSAHQVLAEWPVFHHYLQTSRINVNVRQVLPEGGQLPQ